MDPINFSLQVNVTLGVSKELGDILSKLSNLPPLRLRPVETQAQTTEQAAPVEAAPAAAEQKPAEPEKAAPAADPAPAAQKEYTTEDVRAAMDRCRQRVEGEDYKNTKTEGRTKWHAVLTERFKDIAGWVVKKEGQEKPSQLPDSASRGQFIAMVDVICLSEDGEKLIDDDLPF